MIPVSATILDSKAILTDKTGQKSWQHELAQGIKTTDELLQAIGLQESELPYQVDHTSSFKTRIPMSFVKLIEPGNPFDPILLQVIPRAEEVNITPNYSLDPLAENEYSPTPGLIHKYSNRVLLIAQQACAIHCRYCFRRHFPYSDQRLTGPALAQAITYIQTKPEVNEIILSGGDPLNLSDEKFTDLLNHLTQLEQIKTIRIHTRTAVTLPSRMTTHLEKALTQCSKKIVIVFHINHANEISEEFRESISRLRHSNITLLNQAVLLKQVNNNVPALIDLSEQLFATGIMPYYLHQLDKVKGTAHFNVTDEDAQLLWSELQKSISGYLLPRLVQEIPRRASKTWVNNTAD